MSENCKILKKYAIKFFQDIKKIMKRYKSYLLITTKMNIIKYKKFIYLLLLNYYNNYYFIFIILILDLIIQILTYFKYLEIFVLSFYHLITLISTLYFRSNMHFYYFRLDFFN